MQILNSLNFVDEPRIWEKWDTKGNAKRHRGTTFVCHLVPDSSLHQIGVKIVEDIRAEGLASDYGLLPPSSLHMTVLEGLKDRNLIGQQEKWPEWLKDTEDYTEAVRRIADKIAGMKFDIPRFTMKTNGVYPLGESLTISLVPENEAVAADIREFRISLAEALEFTITDADSYRFHCSLGYRLTVADDQDEKLLALKKKYDSWVSQISTVDLEDVAFNIFNDMLSFPPLVTLKK